MKREILIIICCIGFLQLSLSASAHKVESPDTACVSDSLYQKPLLLYFRFDRSLVEYHYMDNPHTLEEFSVLFSDSLQVSHIDTIHISAYASPDGDARYNLGLARRRAVAVKGYLIWKYPYLDQRRILIRPQGEDWQGLRQLVEADIAVPNREEVLEILTKVSDKEKCKVLLRRLNCGYAYRYIHKHLLPELRNAAVCTVRLKTPVSSPVFAPDRMRGISIPEPVYSPDSLSGFLYTLPVGVQRRITSPVPFLALKTNLLSWAGLTGEGDLASFRPNLSAEVFFARCWSVQAAAEYSYWQGGTGNKFWGVSGYSIEPRFWFSGDGAFRWFYLGAYGQTGDFDYRPYPAGDTQADGSSVTGTYWSTGLSLGVYFPFTPHWGLEAGLRGGYRKSAGKAYDHEPPHAYYHHDAPSTYWGITSFNLSLSYRWLYK